jgi:RNA polymerase sigma-70 factor (ECF subfamily)
MLCELMPDQAENAGLLALMLLQDARREARIGAGGELIPLEEQDRSRWDRAAMAEGARLLEPALRMGAPGPYQIQAAIAAVHSEAVTAAETDWRQIAALYADLMRRSPSPVIALNHAVAVAMSEGLEVGLERIEAAGAAGELDRYHLFHAARADILRRMGRRAAAAAAYDRAMELASNEVELTYLRRRRSGLG